MNDEQLESLLREADRSAGAPRGPRPDLADRARSAHARHQQRLSRIKYGAALGSCFVAGMVTMWTVFHFSTAGEPHMAEHRSGSSDRPERIGDMLPLPHRSQDSPSPANESTESIKPSLVAEKSRYQLLRQLGDENQRRGDVETAVAYYIQALDVATSMERRISYQQDSWLLISLKKDRLPSEDTSERGDSI